MLNDLISITVSNYRSILDPVTIPLSEKFTFLVGGNNSGKTSILRIMAHMFHGREPLVSDDDPVGASEKTLAKTTIQKSAILMPQFEQFKTFYQLCEASAVNEFSLLHRFYDKTPTFELDADVFEITSKSYFLIKGNIIAQSQFMDDFKNGGDVDFNLNYAGKTLVKYGIIPTTIHVPSQRAILNSGAGISQFGQLPWPGNSIEMETIVAQLDALLRNSGSRQERLDANKKVANICNFLQYCLEVEQVSLQVPQNSETILIKIGNLENPISHVGSGIEQLLLLAIASLDLSPINSASCSHSC
jgi:energy-coupling factor transporter ATP-binding protein EcfA2